MVTLKHAVKIPASRRAVYHALTDLQAMQGWHLGIVEGVIAVGQMMTLAPSPGRRFSWRTDRLVPDAAIVQTQVDGPGSSVGKILTFEISDLADGRTQVDLTHGEWAEDDAHLPFCNTHWGEVLYRLKSYVEKA